MPSATPAPSSAAGPSPATCWTLAHGRALVLDRPRIMAILNVTPDSFSDGGLHFDPQRAIDRALEWLGTPAGHHPDRSDAIAHDPSTGPADTSATPSPDGDCTGSGNAGADLIDIGGESTRPGATRVPAEEQIRRVVPVIEGILRTRPDALISVDTTHSEVARVAVEAGAVIINDVAAGTEDARLLELAGATGAGLILMHRLRPPDADRYSDRYVDGVPVYDDVVREVGDFLVRRARMVLDEAGVRPSSIVLDPGLGFGKTVTQNYELIARTAELFRRIDDRSGAAMAVPTSGGAFPLLSAASRKSFIGRVSGVASPAERLAGTLAVSVAHYLAGVRLFRVHDVAAHRQALAVAARIADPTCGSR